MPGWWRTWRVREGRIAVCWDGPLTIDGSGSLAVQVTHATAPHRLRSAGRHQEAIAPGRADPHRPRTRPWPRPPPHPALPQQPRRGRPSGTSASRVRVRTSGDIGGPVSLRPSRTNPPIPCHQRTSRVRYANTSLQPGWRESMSAVYRFVSNLLKTAAGRRRHYGKHASYAGHLADSCTSIS